MAKLPRKNFKIIGEDSTTKVQIGSSVAATPTISDDPEVLQSLATFLGGFKASAFTSGVFKAPVVDEIDAALFSNAYAMFYLFQEGIPEYNTLTEYHINSIVKKTGTYELYGSIIINNTGNALPSQVDNANWQYLGDLAALVNIVQASESVAGIAEISSTAEARAATDNTKILSPSTLGQLYQASTPLSKIFSAPYQDVGGNIPATGHLHQSGTVVTNGAAGLTVVFPIAFPNAVQSLSLVALSGDGNILESYNGLTNSQFNVYTRTIAGSAATTVIWHATGY